MAATTPGQTTPSPAETGAKDGIPMPIISSHLHSNDERPPEVANGRTSLPIRDLRRVDSSSSSHFRRREHVHPSQGGVLRSDGCILIAVRGDAMPFARDARDRGLKRGDDVVLLEKRSVRPFEGGSVARGTPDRCTVRWR